MRLTGHSGKQSRRSGGQALVEFALVIPIFMTIFVAIAEFVFLFGAYASVSFASHDSSELAATYGNTAGANCAVLQRIDQDISAPANATHVQSVDIFWVDPLTALPVPGAETIYTYNLSPLPCTLPDGVTVIQVPFKKTADGYPESSRCNVNQGIGCASGHSTVDTLGVTITYQYNWVTPFPRMIGGSSTGPVITSTTMMRLEPVR